MSETNSVPPAAPQTADLPPDVTSGEKIMAALAIAFAVMIALIGVDMLTGGKITGMARGEASDGG
jgi:hypothetical protein